MSVESFFHNPVKFYLHTASESEQLSNVAKNSVDQRSTSS